MPRVLPTTVHAWVKWSVTAVDVIVDPFTETPCVTVLLDAVVGEQVGCQLCGEPLTDSSAKSPCEGDTEL